jgi:anti-sigma regulatory factor (Ser/Thr protein kinase)
MPTDDGNPRAVNSDCLQENRAALSVVEAAVPASIPTLRHRAREFAAAHGDQHLVADVALAVSEAVTNVVKYAYEAGAEGSIELAASADEGWLDVWVRDRGTGFGRGSEDGLGLGLTIIARLCDDMKIVQEGTGTEVQMRFGLSG